MKRVSFLLFIISWSCLYSQNTDFRYKNNPYNQGKSIIPAQSLSKESIDITSYLPNNYSKDGKTDYTSYIQKGINENKIVKMPDFPILINEKGIHVNSGSRILFQKKSSLRMNPTASGNYGLLKIDDVSDVVIYAPVLIGDRKKHLGDKGEWGMGIYILGGKNITIYNPRILDCWGDGIYIGAGKSGSSKKIKIVDGYIDNSRRNGISITDGSDIEIRRIIISNSNGTRPMSGIDIEPNHSKAVINNIHIINPITFNNKAMGITLYMEELLGIDRKNVNIKIESHIDNGSDVGLFLGDFKTKKESKTKLNLIGNLEIINPYWINNREPIVGGDIYKMGPTIKLKNIKIQHSSKRVDRIKREYSKKENVLVE